MILSIILNFAIDCGKREDFANENIISVFLLIIRNSDRLLSGLGGIESGNPILFNGNLLGANRLCSILLGDNDIHIAQIKEVTRVVVYFSIFYIQGNLSGVCFPACI